MNHSLESESVVVRNLRPGDMAAVVAVDAKITGQRREQYFKLKLAQALSDTGIMVSLAAEVDGRFAGFVLARVYYGEFGSVEQVCVLDTFVVDPGLSRRGAGRALLRQLRTNLLGLGISTLRTEVEWDNQALLAFFHHVGFCPAPRLSLDQDLRAVRIAEEATEAATQR
jgi:ribosomal protein S18 acetylase RimI-like enzyme